MYLGHAARQNFFTSVVAKGPHYQTLDTNVNAEAQCEQDLIGTHLYRLCY